MSTIFLKTFIFPPRIINEYHNQPHGEMIGRMLICPGWVIARERPDWYHRVWRYEYDAGGCAGRPKEEHSAGACGIGIRNGERRYAGRIQPVSCRPAAGLILLHVPGMENLLKEGYTAGAGGSG